MVSAMTQHDDSVYYRTHGNVPLAQRVSLFARRRMFNLFMRTMGPDENTTVLDIGASAEETKEANLLEKLYPWPSQITCTSLGSGTAITAAFPGIRHVTIEPNQSLPFRDQEFDIAYSNAVLEHVGGPNQRRQFLYEAQRVSRSLFFLVPNRWFPFEHHTGIPLLHWNPRLFRKILAKGRRDYWTHRENLEFLSIRLLKSECASTLSIKHTGIPLGPLSSNIAIFYVAN
jgi:hypothetical protein